MSNPEAKKREREKKRINEEIFHIYCNFAHVCYVCLLVRALFIMYELCIGCLCEECSRSSVPPSIFFLANNKLAKLCARIVMLVYADSRLFSNRFQHLSPEQQHRTNRQKCVL